MNGKKALNGVNFSNLDKKSQIPDEFKDLAKDFADKGFITTSSDNLINWARTGSIAWTTFSWPVVLLK